MENWRGVLGYEDWYEVSDLGRCRSIQRPIRGGGRCFNEEYPLILKPLAYRKGYVKIHLGKCNGTRPMQRKFLHRMVWEAFNGPIPRGLTINHKNGVKSDNRLENLEVMTNLENHIHSRSLRTRRWKTADGWVRARLTPEDVREIRSLYATGAVTYNQLASAFGVVKGTIGHILSGRYWKHVD